MSENKVLTSLNVKYATKPTSSEIPENLLKEIEKQDVIKENFDLPTLKMPDLSFLNCKGGTAGHLLFFYNMVIQTNAKKVLEIGLGGGLSTKAFLGALKETNGFLLTVEKEIRDSTVENIKKLELSKFWQTVEGSSQDQVVIRQAEKEAPYDILLVDGHHSYDSCRNDFCNYAPFVKLGGYIFIHDSITREGIIKFIDELETRNHCGCNFAFSQGLYVLRKTSEIIW